MFEALVYHTYEQYIKFIKFNLLHRKLMIMLAPALILFLGCIPLFIFQNENAFYVLIAAFALPFIVFALSLKSANGRFEKNIDYLKISTCFQFNEDYMIMINYSENKKHISKLKYNEIYKVYETRDCFYIFLTENFAHYIPKRDINKGTSEELGNLLYKKLGRKFKG